MNFLFITGAILLLVLINSWCLHAYKQLNKDQSLVKEAFNGLLLYLQLRNNLVSSFLNMADTIENDTGLANELYNWRNQSIAAKDVYQQSLASRGLQQSVHRLLSSTDRCTAVKTNDVFIQLKEQWMSIEESIGYCATYYNKTARDFNKKMNAFPRRWLAPLAGIKPAGLFQ